MAEWIQIIAGGALLGMPVVYVVAAVGWPRLAPVSRGWAASLISATVGLGLAGVSALGWLLGGEAVKTVGGVPGSWLSVRVDPLSVLMSALIAVIAAVIIRYARDYLDRDPGEARFIRWFWATVASIAVVVISNHLLVLLVGWVGASLSLHHLLSFYPDRKAALLAAHKKFLLSRTADVCLLTGFLLLGRAFGTLRLDVIFQELTVLGGGLSVSGHVAAVLLAFAAVLKCAQLPFHGWLIQVMEAPTPVSALLHAGIVNIGGFLMIRLAPVMVEAPVAQGVLVGFGTVTAVVAGLVMMTRISIKVMLAWSTCAQMGFMLMECGLGAYSLALLHLLAHSFYKAYSFLRAGSAVETCVRRHMAPETVPPGPAAWAGALGIGVAAVGLAGAIFGCSPSAEPALWALAGIVSVGAATLTGESLSFRTRRMALTAAGLSLTISLLYFGWHELFALWTPLAHPAHPPVVLVGIVLVAFLVQFVVYAAIRMRAQGPVVSRLQVLLYHGLYLDELFTRLTFLIWTPRVPRQVLAGVSDPKGGS